jgi:predicted small integral membrane protein
MTILIVIITQFLFSFCRLLNIRYTAKDKIALSLLTSFVVKLSWLVSASIGIKSIYEYDYVIIIVYILSGLIGEYISFLIKIRI